MNQKNILKILFSFSALVIPFGALGPQIVLSQDILALSIADQLDRVGSSVAIRACGGKNETVNVLPQDEIWVVSARDSHLCPSDLSLLTVKKRVGCEWVPMTLQDLVTAHKTDCSRATVMFVHGNRTNESWGLSRSMSFYGNVFGTCETRPAVRFVIWQWKSEREAAAIRDFQIKSARAVQLGKTMSLALAQFGDRNLTLVGYSLGSQMVLSSLTHASALPQTANQYRVALIASALNCNFGEQVRCRAGQIQNQVAETRVFQSRLDRAVNISKRLCKKKKGHRALFLQDIVRNQWIPLGKQSTFEVANETGRKHSVVRYSKSVVVQRQVRDLVTTAFSFSQQFPFEPEEFNSSVIVPVESDPLLLGSESVLEPEAPTVEPVLPAFDNE